MVAPDARPRVYQHQGRSERWYLIPERNRFCQRPVHSLVEHSAEAMHP